MTNLFTGIYGGKTVLITGHTGFKGSWLAYWLKQLGANVVGYALAPSTAPNHFDLLNLDLTSVIGDIRDTDLLAQTFSRYQPDIVFHLAAQSLVRPSYQDPVGTYETNVIGTLKVFEACRHFESVKAIINVTSDKAYDNKERSQGYREEDPMGGYDPYSSSKGCSELLTASYRNSYFNLEDYQKTHCTLLASCRAGNVIGGGDWAQDRLIPDMMIAVDNNEILNIRNPSAMRPWQHVLEPLSGYLAIGQKLLNEEKTFADGWNFGPPDEDTLSVIDVLKIMQQHWDKIHYGIESKQGDLHEANLLKLDCSKALKYLQWRGVWHGNKTFEQTSKWYRAYYEHSEITTANDLAEYVEDAKSQGANWTS